MDIQQTHAAQLENINAEHKQMQFVLWPDILSIEFFWLSNKWLNLNLKSSSSTLCSALLLSALSSKFKLRSHRPLRSQRCKLEYFSFLSSTFLPSRNICLFCNYSCTKSCLLLSLLPLQSLTAFYPQPSWNHTQLLFLRSRKAFFYSAGHRWGGVNPSQVDRKCGRSFHIKQPAEEWCLCIVKGRSEDVGEGEEGTASFTPECRSWFLREECGHRSAALLCVHTWVCEV